MKYINDWKMELDGKNYDCSIPCSMYSTLIKNGVIPNPYVGLNENAAVPYYYKDCVFTSEFFVGENELKSDNVYLCFYRLDTLCDIYLNGELLSSVSNFHLEYRFDVRGVLRLGKNDIKLHFHSAVNYINEKEKEYPLACYGTADGKHGALFGFGQIRKPNYSFGWDWGPCLPDLGILKPVTLECYDDRLQDFCVTQKHCENVVLLDVNTQTLSGAECEITITAPDKTTYSAVTKKGKAQIEIKNPELWWPNGYGAQPLYTAEAVICGKSGGFTHKKLTLGLRTLEVLTADDCYGREFTICVNGVKIFAMGANFIPTRTIIPEQTRDMLEELTDTAVKSHFNILRVWGGGTYESEDFYDLCDKKGLLVWQDCAIACTQVRTDKELSGNLEKELRLHAKRIKSHPSLAIIAGNNEVEQMILDEVKPEDLPRVKAEYVEIFEKHIPAVLKEVAPEVFYWPSSPCSGGNFYKTHDANFGDGHYWGCFSGFDSLEKCRAEYHRFLSEFGFQAYPPIKTILEFAEQKDLNPASPIIDNHQRSLAANRSFGDRIMGRFLYPTNFGDFAYATQIMQVETIRRIVEHLRANRGHCMGVIYWQLNDCWPVISWSSVDWKNRYKPLQYAVTRMYSPTIVTAKERDYIMDVYVSAEKAGVSEATLRLSVKTNENKPCYIEEHVIKISDFKAEKVREFNFEAYLKGHEHDRYVHVELLSDNKVISQYIYIAVKPKAFNYLAPNFNLKIERAGEKTFLNVESSVFVDSIVLDTREDIEFSDNLLYITDDTPAKVELKNAENLTDEQIISALEIRSIYDIAVIKTK